jgi:hypothetical protein
VATWTCHNTPLTLTQGHLTLGKAAEMRLKLYFLLIFLVSMQISALLTGCVVEDRSPITYGSRITTIDDGRSLIGDSIDSVDIVEDDQSSSIEYQRFYFVKVVDNSDNQASLNPGADIDAVRLTKANGVDVFASTVIDYKPLAGVDISPISSLPDNILGEPTAFAVEGEDFNTASEASRCSLNEEHYLGLGGWGGYVIVGFDNYDIANGDVITVYEIGNCQGNAGTPGYADAVTVEISVGRTIDEEWLVVLAFTAGPVMAGVVTGLPLIPLD